MGCVKKRLRRWGSPVIALSPIVLVIAAVLSVRIRDPEVASPPGSQFESGGFVTSATVRPVQVTAGSTVAITVSIVSRRPTAGIVDIEVYGPERQQVFQKFFDNQELTGGSTLTYTADWDIPACGPTRLDIIKIGVFTPGWANISHWNDNAAQIPVSPAARSPAANPRRMQ
jgi:hypothetical protein